MQRQEIEQSIYQQTHQLPIEDLTEVLRFVEFVQFKSKNRIKSKIPNQETIDAIDAIDAIEAAERGEYETVGLDELRQQWDET
jgi:hypothetical protein